ncbi:MAG: DUF692 domain-containing protein [Deltaproteobacteria bacterium]|nr:DUF692 domain-containing protein [Deltaproteobacteria bacterium]
MSAGDRLDGVGIGLRREHWDALPVTSRRVDWLEIVPENFLADGGRASTVLAACAERWPIGAHGVSLSLGGPDPLDDDLLGRLGRLLDAHGVAEMTEHACWSRGGGRHFHDLLPLPSTEAAAEHLGRRARAARERLGRPLLLENITWYAAMPTGAAEPVPEGSFLRHALEEAGAGLLLDVNNVYVNAKNHGLDPLALLLSLPLELTGRIHLAGHVAREGMLVDNHGRAVHDDVWALYERALERTGPVPTLVEWDLDIPALDVVLDEADKARALLERARTRARAAAQEAA